VLEAMSAGLPIVATRVGGASIQIGREGERFLVPSGDPPALADRLLELIENERLRLRLGAAMRTRVERVFSMDRVAAVYEQAYELMLSGRRQQIGQLNSTAFAAGDPEDSPCAG
jgi:glycosyltransferase involved in cell wall biosynthesis